MSTIARKILMCLSVYLFRHHCLTSLFLGKKFWNNPLESRRARGRRRGEGVGGGVRGQDPGEILRDPRKKSPALYQFPSFQMIRQQLTGFLFHFVKSCFYEVIQTNGLTMRFLASSLILSPVLFLSLN